MAFRDFLRRKNTNGVEEIVYPINDSESVYMSNGDQPLTETLDERIQTIESDIDDIEAPVYTEASTLSELQSGETISTAFGKLKKAVSSLIIHSTLKATNAILGHVTLSDVYTSSVGDAASGIGASQAALYNAYNAINTKLMSSKDVPLTELELSDSTYVAKPRTTNSFSYCVRNGICYVYFYVKVVKVTSSWIFPVSAGILPCPIMGGGNGPNMNNGGDYTKGLNIGVEFTGRVAMHMYNCAVGDTFEKFYCYPIV